MSNYSNDEKTKLILLENALKSRNKDIKKLREKLDKADRDYNNLKGEINRLKDENFCLKTILKECKV